MKTLYLWINLGSLLLPLLLSFDKKVAFYKKWPALFPAIAIMASFFILWDHFFTLAGVWGFNALYVSGFYIASLPVEEILFFFTVPYACIFIYECLKAYFPNLTQHPWLHTGVPLVLLGSTLILLFFNFTYLYSGAVAVVLIFLAGLESVRNKQLLRFFIPTFFISIIPMLVVNGLLTAKPVVFYDPNNFSSVRLGTIPLEDFFYNLAMLLMTTVLYEHFLKRMPINIPKTQTKSA